MRSSIRVFLWVCTRIRLNTYSYLLSLALALIHNKLNPRRSSEQSTEDSVGSWNLLDRLMNKRNSSCTRVRSHTPQFSLSPSPYSLSDLIKNVVLQSLVSGLSRVHFLGRQVRSVSSYFDRRELVNFSGLVLGLVPISSVQESYFSNSYCKSSPDQDDDYMRHFNMTLCWYSRQYTRTTIIIFHIMLHMIPSSESSLIHLTTLLVLLVP